MKRKIVNLEGRGRITILLELAESPKNISQLISGRTGQSVVYRTRDIFGVEGLGLLEEEHGGARNEIKITLTEKGEKVAFHLEEIEKILRT